MTPSHAEKLKDAEKQKFLEDYRKTMTTLIDTMGEMKTAIAAGDLAVEIAVAANRPDSLMASLKLMQMKLKNLISAVSGAATEVSEQSRKFEATSAAFQRSRDEANAQELLKQTKGVGRTLALLEKSIARFKL